MPQRAILCAESLTCKFPDCTHIYLQVRQKTSVNQAVKKCIILFSKASKRKLLFSSRICTEKCEEHELNLADTCAREGGCMNIYSANRRVTLEGSAAPGLTRELSSNC